MTTPPLAERIAALREANPALARQYLSELCQGKRRFTMSIPARQDDIDLVFSKVIHAFNDALPIIEAQAARIAELESAFSPRTWSVAMHEAWHKNLPDTEKAFAALLTATLTPAQEQEDG